MTQKPGEKARLSVYAERIARGLADRLRSGGIEANQPDRPLLRLRRWNASHGFVVTIGIWAALAALVWRALR